MAKKKDFDEKEAELFSIIYEYAINNRMSIGSIETVARSVIKDLKDRAFVE